MAENLYGTPWQERSTYPGFGYAGGFQDILTAYNGLSHRGANKRYGDSQEMLAAQLTHLYTLKQELENDEDEFFGMFGINSRGTPRKESFQKLQDKVDEWDQTNAGLLINDAAIGNKFYEGLAVIQNLAIAAEITEDDWNSILNEAFVEKGGDAIRELLESNPNINIVEILNTIIEHKGNKGRFSTRSSLVDNLSVTIDEKGKIKITSTQGNISPTLQKKIITKLSEHFGIERKKKANYDFKKMFLELFQTLDITPTGQKYIKMALKEYNNVLDDYALNSNPSQIKGFLGEVYNNAFLYFMADGNENDKVALDRITPTGAILNTKGQALVIDTWLDGFGIQVKNYEKNKVMNEGFTFNKSYNAGNFIIDALQLDISGKEPSVGNILLNFFTAYDYNRDYGKIDPSVKERDAYKFWKTARKRMDKKHSDAKAFTTIILPYVDKLIGIDSRFQSRDSSLFIEEKEYRNTFFNISGKYIPSSVVVQALIDTIEKKKSSLLTDMIAINARITSYQQSSLEDWRPFIDNEKVDNIYANRLKYADTSRVGYTVTLDVARIADYLLGQI